MINTEDAWRLILTEIITLCKPYVDIERDVLIDEFLYHGQRENKETFTTFVTKKSRKYDDLRQSLGHEKINCTSCKHEMTRQKELPDEGA